MISWVWGLCLLLGSCAEQEPEARFLELVQFRPANTTGVFLNEPLVFHFSEDLDPTSVLGSAVRIVARAPETAAGAGDSLEARGELQLTGNKLVFTPAPVLAADLSDGGYLPNTTYDVELMGFPRLDGLRGQDGAPLRHSLSLEFRTVDPADPQSGFVFEDSSLDVGLPVILRAGEVEPGEPILLEGEEPLDPATLFAADFILTRKLKESRGRGKRPPGIPLRARLVDNRNRRSARWGEGTTLIELQPLQRLEAGGEYWLQVVEDLRLRDFGGHRVLIAARAPLRRRMTIRVALQAIGAPGSYFEHTETFINADLRSPEPPSLPEPPAALSESTVEAPLGVDGTLAWGSTGRAELRWPAAAGSGSAGFVELGEHEERTDLHGTRLHLAPGVRCELSTAAGPVVLRAQGKLLIEGTLVRRVGEGVELPAGLPADVFVPLGLSPLAAGDPVTGPAVGEPMEELSAWLERTRASGTHCLILIAGGDLVITGGIEADCPVLLVAGGRLRVAGRDLRAPQLITLGEGGGTSLNYEREVGKKRYADEARLQLDSPTTNPLAVPLVFGVRSSSIPPIGGAERWHASPGIGSYPGSFGPAEAFQPRFRVQFLGECEDPRRGPEQVLVDDPVLLVDCPTLRLALTITVGPGEVWDPPWVDSVQVRWDSPK